MRQKEKTLRTDDQKFFDGYAANVEMSKTDDLVFVNTNLSVFLVGNLLASGEAKTDILRDYDYLLVDDLRYAKLYYYLQSNKQVEELVPNYKPTETAIDRFRAVVDKEK